MNSVDRAIAIMGVLALSVGLGFAQERVTREGGFEFGGFAEDESLKDPEGIMTWLTLPRSAKEGETITLEVTIENARDADVFRLSSIDLCESFISGFTVVGVDPEPRHRSGVLGDIVLEYPIDIPAGETRKFRIRLRAQESGIFIGDVDVCEGGRFLTRVAQVRVE